MKVKFIKVEQNEINNSIEKVRHQLITYGCAILIDQKGRYITKREKIVSNFFIYLKDVVAVINEKGEVINENYQIELVFSQLNRIYETEISASESLSHKWIRELEIPYILDTPNTYYQEIVKYIEYSKEAMNSNSHSKRFAKIGFHNFDGKLIFATSNACIYKDKISYIDKSITDGFNLNVSLEPHNNLTESFKRDKYCKLLEFLNQRQKIFLPIFLVNIISVLSSEMSGKGIISPIIFWISGAPGSGKSFLSLLLGTFYNKTKNRCDTDLFKNSIRANKKSSEVIASLKKYRDTTFVLDDIKTENASRLRESLLNNLDTVIRSVYDHQLEGDELLCSAIITGEYIPTGSSTVARMVHFNINNYINDKDNAALVTAIQNEGLLIPDVMTIFISWLCKKLTNDEYMKELKSLQKRLIQKSQVNCGKNNQSRFTETLITLQIAFEMFITSCKEMSIDKYISFELNNFKETGYEVLADLVNDTVCLTNDFDHIYAEAITNMIINREIPIHKASRKYIRDELDLFNYCIADSEGGIFIEDANELNNNFSKLFAENFDCLLIQIDILDYVLKDYLNTLCNRNEIPKKVLVDYSIKKLAECQLLLVNPRSDNYSNYLFNYPTYTRKNRQVSAQKVYRINITHPGFERLLKYFKSQEYREMIGAYTNIPEQEMETYKSNYDNDYYHNKVWDSESATYCNYKCACQYSGLNSHNNEFKNIFNFYFEKPIKS